MANLRDVARLAGYDPSTVSRVLRQVDGASVRPETRERILEAAKQLNYRPNFVARSLRTKRTGAIALLVPDLENPGFSTITHGVQDAAEEAGYLVLLGEVNPVTRNLHERLVLEGRVDGILAAYAQLDDRPHVGDFGAPLVILNRQVDWATGQVVVDDQAASRVAVDAFVELGHRSIGHLTGSLRTDTGVRRERGFLLGLAAHSLTMDARWRVEGDYTEAGGYAAACELAALRPQQRPTALLVGNLMMGLGVLRAFRESGIAIPGDISVIVLDEHPMAAYSDPSLTTVRMPLREMGITATRMLIGAIAGEPASRVIITDPPPTLIRRESAGPGPFLGS